MDKIINFFKRTQVWGFFLSMAIMAVISVVYFAPDNIEGNSLMQSDIQQGQANGHEAQLYGQATGEKALWTNSLFSGMPTFQISPSYPSNDLFTWLNGLYGLWLPAPSNLLFMMMFGFLIMMYCMRTRWYYALIGAVAWGFSSYFMIIIGAGHIWKFLALTYVPPTLGGIVLCYRGRYVLGAALTALFAMLQLNANHPQMTYYFGFVILGFAIVYLIYAIKDKKVKSWALSTVVLVGAGALAVGANLPSLYNTYEYAKETKRTQSELTPQTDPGQQTPQERPTGGLPKSDIVGWSYGGSEMFSLLIPNVKGGASARPEHGQMTYWTLDRLDSAKDAPYADQPYLQYFSQYFNDSEGTNGPVYVGALICALFILGCILVRGPMKWCLLVLTILSILLALGRNFESLTDLMIYNFPMYNKFRAVESILVIAEFTMPLLAVLALVELLKVPESKDKVSVERDKERKLLALYISFGVCALICIIGLVMPKAFGAAVGTANDTNILQQMQQADIPTYSITKTIESLRLGMVREDSLTSLVFILIGFAVLWFAVKRKVSTTTAVAVVALIVLVDLYRVDKRYVSTDNFVSTNGYAQAFDPFAPDQIDQSILADTTMSYRVMDIPGFGSATRSYHHKMIGGYHAAKLNRYEDLIRRRMQHVLQIGYMPDLREDSVISQLAPDQQDIAREMAADYRVLDMLNAKYIITGEKDYPLALNPYALGNAWLVDEISYVDDADAEMAALETLDPAHQAVADKRFMAALGNDVVRPVPGDTIYMTSYTPNKLTYHVDTKGGGLGVFSEIYFPWGWHAEIDGKPADLGRVNYVLRALKLPAGSHTVTMEFDPESLHTTGTVAYACVSLIYLLVLAGIFVSIIRKERPGVSDGLAE